MEFSTRKNRIDVPAWDAVWKIVYCLRSQFRFSPVVTYEILCQISQSRVKELVAKAAVTPHSSLKSIFFRILTTIKDLTKSFFNQDNRVFVNSDLRAKPLAHTHDEINFLQLNWLKERNLLWMNEGRGKKELLGWKEQKEVGDKKISVSLNFQLFPVKFHQCFTFWWSILLRLLYNK